MGLHRAVRLQHSHIDPAEHPAFHRVPQPRSQPGAASATPAGPATRHGLHDGSPLCVLHSLPGCLDLHFGKRHRTAQAMELGQTVLCRDHGSWRSLEYRRPRPAVQYVLVHAARVFGHGDARRPGHAAVFHLHRRIQRALRRGLQRAIRMDRQTPAVACSSGGVPWVSPRQFVQAQAAARLVLALGLI